jgi:hypothetical protein
MSKEKTAEQEQKINYTETDKVKLIVKVPNLTPKNAAIVARDVRFALENSARLNLLDVFSTERKVEYAEVKST